MDNEGGPPIEGMNPDGLLNPPLSCVQNLITNNMYCGQQFTEQQKIDAYQKYVAVTGYTPIDWNVVFQALNEAQNINTSFNTWYTYLPIGLIFLVMVWLAAGFKMITWAVGVYLTVLIVVVLYTFSIIYRLHVQNNMGQRFSSLEQQAEKKQLEYENSVAKIPQALLAVACSLTGGNWECNDPNGNNPCTCS